ncbi:MAG: ImmA/IrrE family metallo-endopeptidase [Clostridia bacterium]|nr:ImmA/IrrE family metallo-endopeptidase [Clostridia bacterium]
MANPQHLANELLTRCKLKRPTLEDVIFLVGENGYEIIDFEPGSPSAENLFKELSLNEAVCSQDAFLYTNHDVKLLFLKDSLDADEKKVAAAHELGHIVCGHSQTRPSVKEEYEANEFVHYFLNPPRRLRFRNMTARHKWRTAFIVLAIVIAVVGGIFAYNAVIDQKYTQYYVTSSGGKYHLRNCTRIKGKSNIRRLSREELTAGDYGPCEACLSDLIPTD